MSDRDRDYDRDDDDDRDDDRRRGDRRADDRAGRREGDSTARKSGRRRTDRDEFDDRPRRRRPESNGAATAALVLGILSFFCSVFTALPAIVCGVIGLSKAKRAGTGKGMAVAGLVLGLLNLAAIPVMIALMLPAVQKVRAAAENANASNNLKQVGLAFHNFHDANGRLPATDGDDVLEKLAGGKDVDVDPSLSWRVALLPYVEQDALFRRFNPGQPWDGPANRKLADTVVPPYSDPKTDGAAGAPATRYRVFTGPGALFDPARKDGPLKFTEVTDGLSNTVLAVEAADKVPWPQDKELAFDPNGPLPAFGRPGAQTFLMLMADGSVRSVPTAVNAGVMKKAITATGGEVFSGDDFDR